MKKNNTMILLALSASLAILAGCDKGKEPQVNEPTSPTSEKTDVGGAEIGKAVEAAKPAIENAVTTATNTAAAAADMVGPIIDQAKALVGQNKYTEALSSLQKLSGMTLNESQSSAVNSLKEQIQKAMAAKATTDAAGTVGGLLPK